MPCYSHQCTSCNHEWDDTYSIVQDPPKVCPSCQLEGSVKRLISDGISGKMIMSTSEFKAYLKEEKKKIKKQFDKDEKLKANLMGESNYHNMTTEQQRIDKNYGKEIKKIDKKLNGD